MRIPPHLRDLLPLPLESLKQLAQLVGQPNLVSTIKEAAEKVGIKETNIQSQIQQFFQQAGKWVEAAADPWTRSSQRSSLPGINATGEIFSARWTNGMLSQFTRSPYSNSAESDWSRWWEGPAGSSADYLTHFSEPSAMTAQLKTLVLGLTGATHVAIVANPITALAGLAHAHRMAHGTSVRWIVPRIDCVRIPRFGIPGPSSLRSVLDEAGAVVHEVGSNMDCTPEDLQSAFTSTAVNVLVLASPNGLPEESTYSNYRKEAGAIANQSGAITVELLLNGSLHAVPNAPSIASIISDRWDLGADILLVPCDAMLGGPEACLILARRSLDCWEPLQKWISHSGAEASTLTQSSLYHALKIGESQSGWERMWIGECLSTSLDNLRNRADRIALQLAGTPKIDQVAVKTKECRIGAGVWGSKRLPSSVLELTPKGMTPSALAEELASMERPIWCNVQSTCVELVLRTVEPDDDRMLVQRLTDSEPNREVEPAAEVCTDSESSTNNAKAESS